MKLLAIDPGTTESAYVIIDSDTYKPIDFGKVTNEWLRSYLCHDSTYLKFDRTVIEMFASYGMSVGQTVFDTCVWIGIFKETIHQYSRYESQEVELMYRKDVKMNLCGQMKAKDSNIIQALIDRFAYNVPNRGKGYKKSHGFFYGFKADIHQAYALGVTYIDKMKESIEV